VKLYKDSDRRIYWQGDDTDSAWRGLMFTFDFVDAFELEAAAITLGVPTDAIVNAEERAYEENQ